MKSRALDLRKFRLVACLGPGGVGKTTLSAALAVAGAAAGRAVDVMTVDPAPRLLDALGLDASDAAPREVPLDGVAPARRNSARAARLRAMRLDPKRTFDTIVARYAPSDAARDAILENRIYRNLSSTLAGVGDYMAMEKLLELSGDAATDLLVLDTPPAAEALDFLDAPRRMLELLNSRAVSLLGAPAGILRSRLRVVDLAARAVLSAFDRITGLNLLGDVQAFVRSFDGMYAGFAERAERAAQLLRARSTAIVVVTTAEPARIAEAHEFTEALERAGLAVSAIVVNRVMPALPDARKIASARLPAGLKRKLVRNLGDYAALRKRETTSIAALHQALGDKVAVLIAPDLGREPRRLAELAELGRSLTAV